MKLPKSQQPPDVELLKVLNWLQEGIPVVKEKEQPDLKDRHEETRLELENKLLKEKLQDRRSDRVLRENYAKQILGFLKGSSVAVFFLVVFDAGSPNFTIPENAVVTLVGSTAIAAIGLVGFVVKGLF